MSCSSRASASTGCTFWMPRARSARSARTWATTPSWARSAPPPGRGGHALLVSRLGLDGVPLLDAARSVRKVRKDLGDDAIVGAFCHASRHDGMTAGELGADYVSFGPVGAPPPAG